MTSTKSSRRARRSKFSIHTSINQAIGCCCLPYNIHVFSKLSVCWRWNVYIWCERILMSRTHVLILIDLRITCWFPRYDILHELYVIRVCTIISHIYITFIRYISLVQRIHEHEINLLGLHRPLQTFHVSSQKEDPDNIEYIGERVILYVYYIHRPQQCQVHPYMCWCVELLAFVHPSTIW